MRYHFKLLGMNSEEQNTSGNGSEVEVCCRVCLQLEELMIHIFDGGVIEDFQSDLITLLERCGGIKVENSDNLPKYLCKECTTELLVAAKFREKCERAQQLLAAAPWENPAEIAECEPNKLEDKDNEILSTATDVSPIAQLLNERDHIIEVHPDSFVETNLNEKNVEEQASTNTQLDGTIIPQCEEVIDTNLNGIDIIEETSEEWQVMEYFESITCEEEQKQEIHIPNINLSNDIGSTESNATHINETKFTCDSCGAVFIQAANLQRHLEKVHFLLQPYTCPNCSHTFSFENTYINHSISCVKSNDQSYPANNNSTNKTVSISSQRECVYCGKQMQSNFALTMHLRTHTGERPYKCEHCVKAFKTQSAYTMHLKRHGRMPDYSCSICHKTFYETSNLTAHMRTHTGEKPHSCTLCQKRFSRVFLLQLHMRTHTGEKPYQCMTCNRSFAQLCDLKNHERIHTGERKYKCNICGKTFIKRYSLKAHMDRHAIPQPEEETISNEKNLEVLNVKNEPMEDESAKYMLENSMLEGDSYFLSKVPENSFCNLSYEEVPHLSESNSELVWSDFIVEDI
ncbi:zinc finger protein ZFP2 [Zeugodacus cucurbitae]|uniref:Zinc finger protein 568 n=1 Tax=Zeugodacus cucurbitae TaxID=28588 RepID=A0A0A1X191_ZEUCU|nr:zinc finger protein ZFP2 [Zeugodacus cucurbitae]